MPGGRIFCVLGAFDTTRAFLGLAFPHRICRRVLRGARTPFPQTRGRGFAVACVATAARKRVEHHGLVFSPTHHWPRPPVSGRLRLSHKECGWQAATECVRARCRKALSIVAAPAHDSAPFHGSAASVVHSSRTKWLWAHGQQWDRMRFEGVLATCHGKQAETWRQAICGPSCSGGLSSHSSVGERRSRVAGCPPSLTCVGIVVALNTLGTRFMGCRAFLWVA